MFFGVFLFLLSCRLINYFTFSYIKFLHIQIPIPTSQKFYCLKILSELIHQGRILLQEKRLEDRVGCAFVILTMYFAPKTHSAELSPYPPLTPEQTFPSLLVIRPCVATLLPNYPLEGSTLFEDWPYSCLKTNRAPCLLRERKFLLLFSRRGLVLNCIFIIFNY